MADKKISQLTSASTPLAGTEVFPIVQSSTTNKVSVANLTAGRAVTGLSFTADNACAAGGAYGFVSSTYQANAQNPIWSFGNAPSYGISYFQGSAGIGGTDIVGIHFDTATAAGSPFQFAANGTLKVTNELQPVNNLRMLTAGKGVDFSVNTPAAGMTSQLLNWYEEGTWTPVLSDGTNNATMDSSSSNLGRYTRIGRLIHIQANVSTTSLGSVSGAVRITGLPFTCSNSVAGYNGIGVGYAGGLSLTAGQSITGFANINSTYILLYVWTAAGGTSAMQSTQCTNTFNIAFSGTYSI